MHLANRKSSGKEEKKIIEIVTRSIVNKEENQVRNQLGSLRSLTRDRRRVHECLGDSPIPSIGGVLLAFHSFRFLKRRSDYPFIGTRGLIVPHNDAARRRESSANVRV